MVAVENSEQSEAEFLTTYRLDKYERPSVAADIVLFSVSSQELDNYRKLPEQHLEVLLVRRGEHPHKGQWALPGGFLRPGETLEQTAYRELREETAVEDVYLEQLYTFSDPDRDPRGWVLSGAYLALANKQNLRIAAGDDADQAAWFRLQLTADEHSVSTLVLTSAEVTLQATLVEAMSLKHGRAREASPHIIVGREASPLVATQSDLAFDHASIITYALERLRNKLEYTDLAFNLLPPVFTLTELQQVYEQILDRPLLAPAFRRKIADAVVATDEFTHDAGHRPSRLYQRDV